MSNNLVGKVYAMENVTVTVKEFLNEKTEEKVQYFEVVGTIGGCRKVLKANVEKDFFLDFLARYVKPIDQPKQ